MESAGWPLFELFKGRLGADQTPSGHLIGERAAPSGGASTSVPLEGDERSGEQLAGLLDAGRPHAGLAESTRVAFATAGIRRALARLAGDQPTACPPNKSRLQPASFGRDASAVSRRAAALGRRYKIGRDRRQQPCDTAEDDLCLGESAGEPVRAAIAFCPLTAKSAPLAQEQRQAKRRPTSGRRRQHRVSILSTNCNRHLHADESELERAHSSPCSGSISMNHLNEMKTSVAALIHRATAKSSPRSGSYGVSCAAAKLTGESPPAAWAQDDERSWWLKRIVSAETSREASSRRRARKRIQTRGELFGGAKFVFHRNSVDLEERSDQKRAVARSKQRVTYCKQVHSQAHQLTMASASVATANREAAGPGASDELLHARQPHKLSSSSLSLTGAAGQNKNLGKLIGKKAARLKELVLQNLGKADRTQDGLFDLYELNFHKQQQQVSKLTKEFKSYVAALRHFHEAGRSLNRCIQQSTGDYQSARHDLVCENLSQLEVLNEDLVEKLGERVLKQVAEYSGEFGEMKEKIAKRHRKLIDYDKSSRLYELMLVQVNKRRAKQNEAMSRAAGSDSTAQSENYQSILRGLRFLSQQQESAASVASQRELIAGQLVDEARLSKFREQFNHSKLMYENINGELHEELPIVYAKKMKSLLAALQSYFALETHYHLNAGKLVGTIGEVIDETPSCADLRQAAMATRKLSLASDSPLLDSNDGHQHQTTIGRDHEQDDDEDEDHDHDFYESGSSSGSRAGGPSASGSADDKARQLKVNAGGSSSGLGSSGADSSCSVGSSSPECADKHEISLEPALEQAEQHLGCAIPGKAEQPAGCSTGAAAAGAQAEPPAVATTNQPDVDSVGPIEAPAAPASELAHDIEARAVVGAEPADEASVEKVVDETSENGAGSSYEAAGFLYRVRTNYKYLAEDVDELCFEPDEIIRVVEFDEYHEPEDGWLTGIREINGQRGLFPANFTQPI